MNRSKVSPVEVQDELGRLVTLAEACTPWLGPGDDSTATVYWVFASSDQLPETGSNAMTVFTPLPTPALETACCCRMAPVASLPA